MPIKFNHRVGKFANNRLENTHSTKLSPQVKFTGMAHESDCNSRFLMERQHKKHAKQNSLNVSLSSSLRVNIHKIKIGPFMVNSSKSCISSVTPKSLFPNYTLQHLDYNEIFVQTCETDQKVSKITENILSALEKERKGIKNMVIGQLPGNKKISEKFNDDLENIDRTVKIDKSTQVHCKYKNKRDFSTQTENLNQQIRQRSRFYVKNCCVFMAYLVIGTCWLGVTSKYISWKVLLRKDIGLSMAAAPPPFGFSETVYNCLAPFLPEFVNHTSNPIL